MSEQEPVESATTPTPIEAAQHVPSPEEMERTRKVMQDSLAGRKPKSLIESLKAWFR